MDSFAEQVYALVRKIPRGKVTTYKAIANALGTSAYRAVGTALNRNPDAPATPCHRVINTDGKVGGFAFGEGKKEALLEAEGVIVKNGVVDSKFVLRKLL